MGCETRFPLRIETTLSKSIKFGMRFRVSNWYLDALDLQLQLECSKTQVELKDQTISIMEEELVCAKHSTERSDTKLEAREKQLLGEIGA